MENVRDVGFQKGYNLENLIRNASFTVYPSEWYENCPFSVIESLMYGTPVIGSDIGGIPELIRDGENGNLFTPGNAEELKMKIQYLWVNMGLKDLFRINCKNTSFDNIEEYYNRIIKVYTS